MREDSGFNGRANNNRNYLEEKILEEKILEEKIGIDGLLYFSNSLSQLSQADVSNVYFKCLKCLRLKH